MEYYRLTIPIPKQPWRWLRFRITTVLLLIAILAILLTWRRDHQKLVGEVMRLRYPGPHYEAAQATGPPDVRSQGDSSRAWCPATWDAGSESLQLIYEKPIVPTAIVVHENFSSGAIVRVTHVPLLGRETTLWEGACTPTLGPAGYVSKLPVTVGIKTGRIKLYFKTTAAVGWDEVDAVGLMDANGQIHWARGAEASSTWGQSPEPLPTFSGRIVLQR